MNRPHIVLLVCLIFIPLTITTMGCSRGTSAIIPDDGTYDSLPAISDAGQSGVGSERQLQGIWSVDCNWISDIRQIKELNQVQNDNLVNPAEAGIQLSEEYITPIRTADFHLNVRPFIRPPDIYIRSWNPTTQILDLDVEIKNTSSYHGYDIRLIIFNDSIGHKLLNPDNYTHLWDIPEGSWSNGFKAYAKENANRILHAGEFRWENIQILCPGGNFSIQFAIDASWPTNCVEPYMINNFTQGMLQAYDGATSDITVDVYDWQNDVESVRIQASAITGETDTYMTQISANKWGVELVNNNAVPEGDYFALIAALSVGSSDPLIDLVTVTVSPEVGNGWAQTWGGTGDDYGNGIAVDNDGNIFVCGNFINTVDFNPDMVEEEIRTSVNGHPSGFLSKFDSYGDFQWVQTFGAEGGYTDAMAVDVNDSGEAFVCGGSSSYLGGVFLIKFSADGTPLWQGGWCDYYDDYAKAIKVRNDGSVVVGGYFTGTADFDPGTGTDNHTSNGIDAFVNVFDTSCNQLWSAVWGGNSKDDLNGMDVDSDNNIICAGEFRGTTDLDPGTGTYNKTSMGSDDCYVIKLDADGDFLWGHAWGGPDWDESADCAVDEFDDVYVVGFFYYTVDFDPDPVDVEERTSVWYDDCFASKIDSGGNFQWVLTWGDVSYDNSNTVVITDNHFWVGGVAHSDLDPGPEIDYKSGKFLSKFDLNGEYQLSSVWKMDLIRFDVATDKNGNVFQAGWFNYERLDFDPGPSVWWTDNYSSSWDCFVVKVLPNGLWE